MGGYIYYAFNKLKGLARYVRRSARRGLTTQMDICVNSPETVMGPHKFIYVCSFLSIFCVNFFFILKFLPKNL